MEPEQDGERTFKRYSIFWALSALMVALGVIPLFFYSQKAVRTSQDFIEDSLRERQLLTANPAASHIQTLLYEKLGRMESLRSAFEVYSRGGDPRPSFENLLAMDILDRYVSEDCLVLIYGDVDGTQASSVWQKLAPQEKAAIEARLQPQIRQALSSPAPFTCSEVFFSKVAALGNVSEPAMALSLPIRGSDRALATLTGVFLLSSVQSSLAEYSKDFSLFVVDERGRLVFHSDPAKAGAATDLSTDPVVNRVLSTGTYPTSPTNTTVSTKEDGKRKTYLVTFTPIPVLDYRWILFSQVDRDKYLASAWELQRQSTLWIAAIILISICACFLFARLITKPILEVTQVSRRLADGDFGCRANEGVRNEVGELARAFNKMAGEIQKYIHEVEAKAEENKALFMNSIRAIANAIDAKDPYTRGHSERVSAYSMIVARECGLDERMLRVIEISSLLHDVGKIGIEDRILRKPGALTNDEFAIMKMHPSKGAEILKSIPQMAAMIPGIKHHHERWGGGGYPDGLKAEQIPLIARIIGVADAFDAMTTNRPYQRAMTYPVAAARVNELMHTVYEVRIVEAFNRAYQKGLFRPIQTTLQSEVATG